MSLSQWQVILGGLLGDSSYYHNKKTITFSHCDKQKEYLEWKWNQIQELRKSDILHTFNTWNGNKYGRSYFYSYVEDDDFCIFLCKHLYAKNGRKKISERYLSKLDILALSIWWMDDGSLCVANKNRYGKLSTNSFNYEENILIQNYFKKKYDINTDIKIEKGTYFLRFNASAMIKLITLIYPYVCQIKCMIRKVDMKYISDARVPSEFREINNYIKSCYEK